MFFYDWKFVSFLVLVVIIGSHFLLETRNILAIGRYAEVIFCVVFFFSIQKKFFRMFAKTPFGAHFKL